MSEDIKSGQQNKTELAWHKIALESIEVAKSVADTNRRETAFGMDYGSVVQNQLHGINQGNGYPPPPKPVTFPKTEATKHDKGKAPLSLIPNRAMEEEAHVWKYGAGVHGRDNWRAGFDWTRIIDAILRHAIAYKNGETLDPDTGRSHMAHIRCDAAMLIEFEVTHPQLDDRWNKK